MTERLPHWNHRGTNWDPDVVQNLKTILKDPKESYKIPTLEPCQMKLKEDLRIVRFTETTTLPSWKPQETTEKLNVTKNNEWISNKLSEITRKIGSNCCWTLKKKKKKVGKKIGSEISHHGVAQHVTPDNKLKCGNVFKNPSRIPSGIHF